MGIDGIGKGGAGAPPAVAPAHKEAAAGADRANGPDKPFEVKGERAAEAPGAGQVAPSAATPLERLRAGEIDVDKYADIKVEEATAHLRGLPASQLASIRATLRQQVASDPALVDLVVRATGRAPTRTE